MHTNELDDDLRVLNKYKSIGDRYLRKKLEDGQDELHFSF